MTFREVNDAARSNYERDRSADEPDYDAYIDRLIHEWQAENPEMQTTAIRTMKKIYEMSGFNRPMIIISIIPPYYPDVYPDTGDPKVKNLLECLDRTIEYARTEYDTTLEERDYYMGLSDLSYTGLDSSKNFDQLFQNVIGVNHMYSLPEENLKRFSVPGIVLGGYGKDFHKSTERLNKKYNFEVLPYLYINLINDLLK